jgi:zinc transporter ZupT
LPVNSLTIAVLLAFSGGFLLYLCISDIIVKEFEMKNSNWKKFIYLFSGMAVENSLWFYELYEEMVY